MEADCTNGIVHLSTRTMLFGGGIQGLPAGVEQPTTGQWCHSRSFGDKSPGHVAALRHSDSLEAAAPLAGRWPTYSTAIRGDMFARAQGLWRDNPHFKRSIGAPW
jgi:hypothetical protein